FLGSIADYLKGLFQRDYTAIDVVYVANNCSTTSSYVADYSSTLNVLQLYLTSVILGKQQLKTIWTYIAFDGLVGTGIIVVNNSFDGLTLAAFAFDSVYTD
ncbi:major outer membrane protein, partial [Campylobacter coli]|uniref:major outer membrane protein n=1 Tax=Campylobacter coli TaxID=195 RepID=UPI001F08DF47